MREICDNYFSNINSYKEISGSYKININKLKEIGKYLNKKDLNILEVGVGNGEFAYLCDYLGIKNYTGIDIDDLFFSNLENNLPNYSFIKTSFQEFLKKNKEIYDIIYVSNVFEHLDESERLEMVKYIHLGLKLGGIWINYMPNADSIILLGHVTFGDITHYRIYNNVAFEQVIRLSGVSFSNIKHNNLCIGCNNKLKKIIHLIFLFFTKIYYLGMGTSNLPKIYTWEFFSILKK